MVAEDVLKDGFMYKLHSDRNRRSDRLPNQRSTVQYECGNSEKIYKREGVEDARRGNQPTLSANLA
jgi:hypothetical protein